MPGKSTAIFNWLACLVVTLIKKFEHSVDHANSFLLTTLIKSYMKVNICCKYKTSTFGVH